MNKQQTYEFKTILQAQSHMVQTMNQALTSLSANFDQLDSQASDIGYLESLLGDIEKNSHLLTELDLSTWGDAKIEAVYQEKNKKPKVKMDSLNYHHWSR